VARPDDDTYDEDDEALRWAGDEETGRAAPRLGGAETDLPLVDVQADDEDEEAPGSRGRNVARLAFLLPYVALTVGWVLSVQQLTSGAVDLAYEIVWQFGEFLALLAAPAWFVGTLHLTRRSRPLVRVGWLALGLGALLPWPILFRFVAALNFVGSVS
jgi:hypothetical protein